jgi:hypothetical protein
MAPSSSTTADLSKPRHFSSSNSQVFSLFPKRSQRLVSHCTVLTCITGKNSNWHTYLEWLACSPFKHSTNFSFGKRKKSLEMKHR